MAALLDQHLRQLGLEARVTSAGTRADGGLATSETVTLLAEHGIDVRGHAGRPLDDDVIGTADLIVTAEHEHVVAIASTWPDAFSRTFTLPELIALAKYYGGRLGGPMGDWLELLNEGRPSGYDYLDDRSVGEIVDPTGLDRRTWREVFALVDDLSSRLAKALT
jgi:protein-tyrosine-phosphatase